MAIIKIPLITDYILIVDDNVSFVDLLKTVLDDDGEIDVAYDGEEGLKYLATKDYDLVVSDIDMPKMDGITFYHQAIQKHPLIKGKFIFITGYASPERLEFFEAHGIHYFLKPARIKDIRIAARKILLLKKAPPTNDNTGA